MNLFFKATIIAVAGPLFLHAQENYKPGYVVNFKGDTLKGFVDYREWNQNPKQISFKQQPDDAKMTRYSRSDTRAFGVNGFAYYERHIVSISRDSLDINVLKVKPEENAVTDTVFIKILTRGPRLTLYDFTDDIKQRFYISETGNGTEPEELSYHMYADPDHANTAKYSKRYKNQLQYEAQKAQVTSNGLESMIAGAAYNSDDMIKIVTTINGGADKRYVAQREVGSRFFVGAGGLYYSMAFTGSGELSATSASTGATPVIDAGIDIFPFRGVQQFYFRVEGGLAYYNYSFSHTDPYSTPAGATITLKMKQLSAALTPQVVYNVYNNNNLKVFIDAGVALNFVSNSNHQQVITFDNFPPSITENYPVFYSFLLNFPVKAGVAIGKKMEVYVVYIPSKAIAYGLDDLSGTLSSYGVGLNYYFGK